MLKILKFSTIYLPDFVTKWLARFFRFFIILLYDTPHLIIRIPHRWPKIALLGHQDFLELIEYELALLRNQVDPEEFIAAAFNKAHGCNYIIFQASEAEFLQFSLSNDTFELNFPLMEATNHPEYYHQLIAALSLHGFSRFEPTEEQQAISFNQYRIKREEPLRQVAPDTANEEEQIIYINEITADFGHDLQTTARFCNYVFEEIFAENLQDVRVEVG